MVILSKGVNTTIENWQFYANAFAVPIPPATLPADGKRIVEVPAIRAAMAPG